MSVMPVLRQTFRSFLGVVSRPLTKASPEGPLRMPSNSVDREYLRFWGFSKSYHFVSTLLPIGNQDRILDLSIHKLDRDRLFSLLQWLKTSSEGKRILRINWNDRDKTNYPELYQDLNAQCARNREKYRDRPSQQECVVFANLAYKSPEEIEAGKKLPPGWEILKGEDGGPVYWGDRAGDSYFGIAFIHPECRFGIIAHRGTEFSFSPSKIKHLIQDLISTDLKEIFGNQVGNQQCSAWEFSNEAFTILRRKECDIVGHVGHSLGGWLAQLSVYRQITEGKEGVFATTLDNPGSMAMIEETAPRYDINRRLFLRDLDFSNFLSYPNVVNTCHEHAGNLFHIRSPAIEFSFLAKHLSYLCFTLQAHNKELLERTFDSATGDVLKEHTFSVRSWPCFNQLKFVNELREFFKSANASNNFQPNVKDLGEREFFWLTTRAHYSLSPYDPTKIWLTHFTKKVKTFLLDLKEVLKYDSNILQDVERDLALPASSLDFLLQYELYRSEDGGEIKISPSNQISSASEFRRQVTLLLETYPAIIENVSLPHLFRELKKSISNRSLFEKSVRHSFSEAEVELLSYKSAIGKIHFSARTRNEMDESNYATAGLLAQLIGRARFYKEAVDILLDTTQQGFVQRLYLYFNASENEIKEHTELDRKIGHLLLKNELLSKSLEKKYNTSELSPELEREISKLLLSTEGQRCRLGIAESMNDALKFHKTRDYVKAEHLIDMVLNQLQKYQDWCDAHKIDSEVNCPLLLARTHSLKAKIARAMWSEGESALSLSKIHYEEALKQFDGEPILHSNLGSLLNDWGEWLSYRDPEPSHYLALEKHQQALACHKKAFEMYSTHFGIRRDYGRALFLHAQALFRTDQLSSKEYYAALGQAAFYIEEGLKTTKDSSFRYNPTALHFLGLIELEIGDNAPDKETSIAFFRKALERFSAGLKIQNTHPILFYCSSLARYKLHKAKDTLTPYVLEQSEQEVRDALQYFHDRRITPEDQYRIGWAQKLLHILSKD